MSTKPLALRLADRLSGHGGLTFVEMHAAATELRRLVAQRDALLEALKEIQDWTARATARAAIAKCEENT